MCTPPSQGIALPTFIDKEEASEHNMVPSPEWEFDSRIPFYRQSSSPPCPQPPTPAPSHSLDNQSLYFENLDLKQGKFAKTQKLL